MVKILEKKILALLQARKKSVAKLFHHSRGALQNPSKTATILDNLQASEPLWLAY